MKYSFVGSSRTFGFSRRIADWNCRSATFWLAGALGAWPTLASAVGVRIMNQDPTAIGRGNAFVATADNPSAIYYNPAGITQLEGQNIQIGALAYLGIYTTYEAPNGQSYDNDAKVIPLPQIYYSFTPDSLPLSFGLGVYAPFGLSMEWPQDTGFRTRSIEAELQYATINPVIGWKPCSFFSVAAGPTISYSTLFFRSGLVSPVQVPNDEFKFDGSGWSAGFNAGILIQPHPKWSIGVNYRSASTTDYDGKTDIKSPIPQIQSGSVDTTLKTAFPQIVSFGVSYRPTPRWNIELNGDYTDWNTLNTLTFKGTSAILGNNASVPFNWHGTWMAEAGVTHYFPSGYYVSAGYFFVGETASEQDFSPTVPDTVLHVGSVGVGYKGKHWRWAAAFQLIAGPEREINHNQANVVDGTYQLWTPTLSASVGYGF